MNPKIPDQPGATYYIDYRPAKCRCSYMLQPHQLVCPNCGRKQTLLFQGLDRLYEDDIEGLIKTFERMAEKSPNDAMLLDQLAGSYLLNGEYEKAKATYQKALKSDPMLAEAHLNLGGVLGYLGEKEAAIKELKEFVRLDLHSPRVERALRAIASLEGRSYEDVLAETGAKGKGIRPDRELRRSRSARREEPKAIDRKMARGTMYSSMVRAVEPMVRAKRAFGVFDVVLWLFALAVIGMIYFMPEKVEAFVNNALTDMETQYMFTAESGDLPGTPIFHDIVLSEDEEEEEEEVPAGIINENPESDSYFPLARDNRWEYATYDTANARGEGTRSNESSVVVRVTGISNSFHHIWRIHNGSDTVFFVERNDGVYSVVGPNGPMSLLITQVPYPPAIGTVRDDDGQIMEVMGEEIVDTSMGMFRCIKIHYTQEATGKQWWTWYGQGVGVVKSVVREGGGMYHARELVSYELN
jgi:tetratricopeptide (TPR) repeat protein